MYAVAYTKTLFTDVLVLLLHKQIATGALDCPRRANESTVHGHAHVQIVSLMRQFWNFVICMNMHNVICLSSLNNILSSLLSSSLHAHNNCRAGPVVVEIAPGQSPDQSQPQPQPPSVIVRLIMTCVRTFLKCRG